MAQLPWYWLYHGPLLIHLLGVATSRHLLENHGINSSLSEFGVILEGITRITPQIAVGFSSSKSRREHFPGVFNPWIPTAQKPFQPLIIQGTTSLRLSPSPTFAKPARPKSITFAMRPQRRSLHSVIKQLSSKVDDENGMKMRCNGMKRDEMG